MQIEIGASQGSPTVELNSKKRQSKGSFPFLVDDMQCSQAITLRLLKKGQNFLI
jgi:hypothetical protein